jgi:hypothetical protein
MKELKPAGSNIRTEAEMTLLKECQKVMASKTTANMQITFINVPCRPLGKDKRRMVRFNK